MERKVAISRMISSGILPVMPASRENFADVLSCSSRSGESVSMSTRPNLPGAP